MSIQSQDLCFTVAEEHWVIAISGGKVLEPCTRFGTIRVKGWRLKAESLLSDPQLMECTWRLNYHDKKLFTNELIFNKVTCLSYVPLWLLLMTVPSIHWSPTFFKIYFAWFLALTIKQVCRLGFWGMCVCVLVRVNPCVSFILFLSTWHKCLHQTGLYACLWNIFLTNNCY